MSSSPALACELVHVLSTRIEFHVPHAHSLKDKRKVVKSIVDTARHRYRVAAAEVDHQETWQRAGLGFAVVASSSQHATDVIDQVESFVWSNPDIEITSTERWWLEET